MALGIRYFLLLYFISFFGLVFIGISYFVCKKINKNPMVLTSDDSAYGLVGLYFKLTLLAIFIYVVALNFTKDYFSYFLPISYLQHIWAQYCGIILMVAAIIWVIITQVQMNTSWRIGIDSNTKTKLVTTGLFRYSRNPVFLGMLASVLGLFLVTPNAFTIIFLIVSYMLIQVQIRFEETFLLTEHGTQYQDYIKKSKRLL